MMEQWRDVKGYEGIYQVSDMGRVKSVERISAQNHLLRERIRKPETDRDGYQIVNLCKDGKVKLHKVHRLVGEAFLDNEQGFPQINHINGVKDDNRVENLEWISASGNVKHAFDSGLKQPRRIAYYGERNPHCKVTDAQCEEIREIKRDKGYSNRRIADMFNIGTSQINRILHGKQRVKGSVCVG